MKQASLLLTLTALIWCTATFPSQSSTLDDYIERLSAHPQITTILAESDAIRASAQGEMGLPDPTFTIGIDNMPISDPAFNRFLPTAKTIGFSQNIPNPFTRKMKAQHLEQVSKKQDLIARYTKARLQFMLITKLAEYESLKTQSTLIKKQFAHYQELERALKSQIEAGRPVYQKLSETDTERAETEKTLNEITAQIKSVEADFIQLVGEIPDLPLPEQILRDWDESPDALYPVLIAGQDIEVAQRKVNIADAEFLPDFGVNAAYKQRNSGENGSFSGDDWVSVQARVTFPLWAATNQEPKRRAAKARKRSAKLAYDNTARSWVAEMLKIKNTQEAAVKNITALTDKAKAMKSRINAIRRKYEAGTQELDSVLKARIEHLNVEIQLAEIRKIQTSKSAEFNSNLATIAKEESK